MAVPAHFDVQPLGEGVHNAHSDTVKASGDLVTLAPELAAGVELRQDDLQRGAVVLLGHGPDGDAATVVPDAHRAVRANGDVDFGAVTRERLVHRVVDDLVHQMVQPPMTGGADVHTRPLPHRFQALE